MLIAFKEHLVKENSACLAHKTVLIVVILLIVSVAIMDTIYLIGNATNNVH